MISGKRKNSNKILLLENKHKNIFCENNIYHMTTFTISSAFIIYQHYYSQYLILDNLLTPTQTRLSLRLQTLLSDRVEGGVFVRVPVSSGDGDVGEILL